MKFIRQKDGSLNIIVADEDNYDVTDDNGVDIILSREQVQELKGVLCASHSNATERDKVLEDVITLLLSSVHPQSNCSKVLREILKNNRLMAELRTTPAPETGELE